MFGHGIIFYFIIIKICIIFNILSYLTTKTNLLNQCFLLLNIMRKTLTTTLTTTTTTTDKTVTYFHCKLRKIWFCGFWKTEKKNCFIYFQKNIMLNETENTMSNTTFTPAFVTSDPILAIIEQRFHECKDFLRKSTSNFSAGN